MAKKVIVCCAAILVLGGLAYYSSYLHSSGKAAEEETQMQHQLSARDHAQFWPETLLEEEEQDPLERAERRAALSDPDSVQAATEEYAFYLGEASGYVIIYHADRQTIYEYTTIPVSSLPEEIQEQIQVGKGVTGEQELYEFLENYSS